MSNSKVAGAVSKAGYFQGQTALLTSAEETALTESKTKADRNKVIDVLRGLCIVSMLTGHFGTETYLRYWTHLPRFFDGAAGFVFLSGLVLGLVHARRIQKHGEWNTAKLIVKRAGLLFIAHIFITLVAFGIHERTGRIASVPSVSAFGGLKETLLLVSTLRLQPFGLGLDILPLYVVFLLSTPVALGMMRRKMTGPVLLISFALYASVQIRPDLLNLVEPRSGSVAFYWAAWQLLFVLGLVIGWHRDKFRVLLRGRGRLLSLVVSLPILTCGLIFAQLDAHKLLERSRLPLPQLYSGFDKPTLGILQLIYFLSSLVPGYLFLRWLYYSHFGEKILGLFAMLGRLSLYCFLVHLGYTLLIRAFVTETWTPVQQEWVTLFGLALVAFMAKFQILRRWIPN